MQLSEASVKRMFALKRMSSERMDDICAVLEIEVSELVLKFEQLQHRISRLTEAQEREIVSDPALSLIAVSVKNHWTFDKLVMHYTLSAAEIIGKLAHLDRSKLIELLPNNRIRLLFDTSFGWIPAGPIETYFEQSLVSEFLRSNFHAPGRTLQFLNGSMTEQSRATLLASIDAFASEFYQALANSSTYPSDQRQHVGMLLAFRPCGFNDFRPFIGDKSE